MSATDCVLCSPLCLPYYLAAEFVNTFTAARTRRGGGLIVARVAISRFRNEEVNSARGCALIRNQSASASDRCRRDVVEGGGNLAPGATRNRTRGVRPRRPRLVPRRKSACRDLLFFFLETPSFLVAPISFRRADRFARDRDGAKSNVPHYVISGPAELTAELSLPFPFFLFQDIRAIISIHPPHRRVGEKRNNRYALFRTNLNSFNGKSSANAGSSGGTRS